MQRLLDGLLALCGLCICSPLLLLASAGIRLCSPGPILYRARRTGRHGHEFIMYKFRTMHVAHAHGTSPITADHDPRIFPFGNFLRKTKIDELPQLVNILIGQMAIIGPRAEDPAIVAAHYDTAARETLRVLPGLSSPGSLYYFTHCEDMLTGDDPERLYLEQVLPLKLALDRIYVQQSGPLQNFRMIGRTVVTILQVLCGQKNFPDPPEMAQARELLGVELPTPEW